MLGLQRRVRDLENVEHAQTDLLWQIWQRARDAEKADLSLPLQVLQRFEAALLLEDLGRGTRVELHHIQVVRAQTSEALLHAGNHVLTREDMRRSVARGGIHRATALGGEIELRSARAKSGTDALLADAV